MSDLGAAEREQLRQTVRDFLTDKSGEAEVRRLMETETGYDPAVWKQMAGQLGLQGLAVPERFGGAGFGYLELQVVFEEMGAALLGAPYLSTVGFAVPALLASADTAVQERLLPGIVAGDTVVTVAAGEGVDVRADAGGRLSGTAHYVLDGMVADVVLVAATSGGDVELYAVDADADGVRRTAMVTLDATRKMAVLELDGAPATRLAGSDDAPRVLRHTLDRAAVALAAEQVGGASRCLQLGAGYARDRVQFGRPIGSFQAVKHKLANVLMEVEQARSAAYFAAREVAEDGPDVELAAAMAHAYCSDAFVHAATECLQVHGGIGFTWEHPSHLYLKRAKSSQLLLGHPSRHRARVAELVGI